MDYNHFLIFIIASSVLWFGANLLRRRPGRQRPRGWMAICGAILALLLGTWLVAPEWAGYLAAVPWAVLFFVPVLLTGAMMRAAGRGRFVRAYQLARILRVFHPGDGVPGRARQLAAMAAVERGDFEHARTLLAELSGANTPVGWEAHTHLFRIDGRWRELIDWLECHPRAAQVLGHPPVQVAFLRALGEVGETSRMLASYRPLGEVAASAPESTWVSSATLFVAALSGQPELVQRLFAGSMRSLPADIKGFWLATALQAAGRSEEARQQLEELDATARPAAKLGIARRLASPLAPVAAGALTEEDGSFLQGAVAAEASREPSEEPPGPRPLVTWAVVIANLLVFLLELSGGSTDPENLYRMGALVIPAQPGDGWWRLISAGFLHAGPLHLLLNVVAIWYFGKRLERRLGRLRFFVCYGVAGPAAMALVLLIGTLQAREPYLLVGASAAAMGIVGATISNLLVRRFRRRLTLALGKELPALFMILVLQTIFDLLTPQVSFTGHMSGVLIGLLLGVVLGEPAEQKAAAGRGRAKL